MKGTFSRLRWALVLITCLLAAACGSDNDSSAARTTTVSGVASKGPIRNGNVSVYAVNPDGTRGRLLGTGTTSSTDGTYQVSNLGYNGNIIVVVEGGDYVDEATGATIPNPGLKAALPSATDTVRVAVTPLTDVAFKQMSSAVGGFTSTNIANYNAVVSTAFGVDIIGTQPVNATDSTAVGTAGQAAIDYGVALAAISRMVQSGAATSVQNAIQMIRTDLSQASPQLTTSGPALSQAITDLTSGPTPVLAPTITPSTISVDNSISFFTSNTVSPPSNASGVAQAKAMIGDLRNTVLSVYNYQTGELAAALQTPFDATVQELETVIQPELIAAAERVGWVVTSLASIPNIATGQTYTFTDPVRRPGETLTITTEATGYTATTTITGPTGTLLSGTATVNDIINPTSGTLNLPTIATQSGNGTATLNFTGTLAGQEYSAVTLTGTINTPVGTFDFSDTANAQRLTATFSPVPNLPGSVMLNSAYFKGVATSNTARLTGTINIPTLVWNENASPGAGNAAIPSNASFTGKVEALSNGTSTLTMDGTLTGSFTNAATYNPNLPESSTNFAAWNGTFDGTISGTNAPNITAFLRAARTVFNTVTFETRYARVLPQNNATIFLTGSGSTDLDTDVTTANLTNQDGLQVAITHNRRLATDQRLTGTIRTAGGEQVGSFSTVSGVPRVTYSDGYFETLL